MISSVKIKNFQSWSELEFVLTPGTCLIKGYNYDDQTAEACGKSALLNAICWGLFGQIPKDTNVDDVIKEGEKSCEVVVLLSSGMRIQRNRKPNDLSIIKDTGVVLRGKDVKETQKLIEREIGFTYETFLQSIYFAQNSLIKFLLLNEDGKAKILSQIADLSIFDEGRKRAHELAREAQLKLTTDKIYLEDMSRSITLIQGQIESLNDVKQKFQLEKTKNIGMLELSREDVSAQINKIGPIPELSADYHTKVAAIAGKVQKYRDEAARLKAELNQQAQKQLNKNNIEYEIRKANEELTHLQVEEAHKCNTCGSTLVEESKQQYIQSKNLYIHKKQQELQGLEFVPSDRLQEEYTFNLDSMKTAEDELKSIQTLEFEVKHKKEKYSILTAQLKQVDKDLILQKNKEYPDIDKRVELLRTSVYQKDHERTLLAEKVKTLTEQQERYDTIKEGFKEVKSLAFQEVLEELNRKTNEYLSELFTDATTIKFGNVGQDGDVSKITTTLTINGTERQLGLFSGGQTRRIMLAVDLAISDIIHSRKGITDKLLILDEYFKDMSEDSMIKVCQLLSKINGKILMIEHNNIVNSLATNVFEIEYRNGTSNVKHTV